jgi:hypothetical protein
MITYIPFLKFKTGEVNAISELDPAIHGSICPFFDFPKKGEITAEEFKDAVGKIDRAIAKHMPEVTELYFDNYDISDSLTIGVEQNYSYLLRKLSKWPIVPVIGIDRAGPRNDAVAKLKKEESIKSNVIALRITAEEFESYAAIQDDLDNLKAVFAQFESIDLVFDLRIYGGANPDKLSNVILSFSKKFCASYDVRRVVVTGSSIPSSIGNVLKVKTECLLNRAELSVFERVAANHEHAHLVFGDYATVSPDYAEVTLAPEIMQNVMTPKFTYTLKDRHFFIRGERIRGNYGQYFEMARKLCAKGFYRGEQFSWGDAYLNMKSLELGGNCTPASVIKPTVNAHISYMSSVLPF